VIAGEKEIYTVDRFEELPTTGNESLLYRVVADKAMYQWNGADSNYEKISGASDEIIIQIIHGGNANGSTN
jgi:hypothetical protein